MADFTVPLINFYKEKWECYNRLIKEVRSHVGVRYVYDHPVTPIEVNPPTRFFDVLLGTNIYNIRVRFRRDNLYLIGYQMHNSNVWLELRFVNDPAKIPGSVALDISEKYPKLKFAAGVKDVVEIQVGRPEFINAINQLAISTNQKTRAKSLLVLAIMISESVRFTKITTHFGHTHMTTAPLPEWIDNYAHDWESLSTALLDSYANNRFVLPNTSKIGKLKTFDEALAIIGTIKG